MQSREVIEEMIVSELKGLCMSCAHAETCVYHKTARKEIIQCELYEPDGAEPSEVSTLAGLCRSCDNALICTLPGKKTGVWRCNDYR